MREDFQVKIISQPYNDQSDQEIVGGDSGTAGINFGISSNDNGQYTQEMQPVEIANHLTTDPETTMIAEAEHLLKELMKYIDDEIKSSNTHMELRKLLKEYQKQVAIPNKNKSKIALMLLGALNVRFPDCLSNDQYRWMEYPLVLLCEKEVGDYQVQQAIDRAVELDIDTSRPFGSPRP